MPDFNGGEEFMTTTCIGLLQSNFMQINSTIVLHCLTISSFKLHYTVHLQGAVAPSPVVPPPAKLMYTIPIMLNSFHWCHHNHHYVCQPFSLCTYILPTIVVSMAPCRPTPAHHYHRVGVFPTTFLAMFGDQRSLIRRNSAIPKLLSHEINLRK